MSEKTEQFWQWIEREMEIRHLTWSAIEREAGLSNAAISRRARELLAPTHKTCEALAQVLRLPVDTVKENGGIRPRKGGDPIIAELADIIDTLSSEQLEVLRRVARALLYEPAANDL